MPILAFCYSIYKYNSEPMAICYRFSYFTSKLQIMRISTRFYKFS